MSKKWTRLLALLMACMMCAVLFAGCKQETEDPPAVENPPVDTPPVDTPPVEAVDTPLVVAYSPFSEKFSPFFADTQYDVDAVDMTQIAMMTTDRMGGIIYNAIQGETVSYNGTDYTYTGPCDISVSHDEATDITTYTVKMRDDIKFSDGEPADADDMLFTYYVYLDPDYVGSTTLSSYDIIGLRNYQTQTTDDVYDKYNAMFADIYAAGEGYTVTGSESFTQAQYDAMWNEQLLPIWKSQVQGIVDYVVAGYSDYFATDMAPGLELNDQTKVAFGMREWGFGKFTMDGEAFAADANGNPIFTGAATGKTWDLTTTFPTIDDYFEEVKLSYEGDPEAYYEVEATGNESGSPLDLARTAFISEVGSTDEGMTGAITSISGIRKVDDYTVEVKTNGYSAPAVYSICGLNIVPMHYYGDAAQWDPDNGLYGHPLGDLSIVRENTTTPMGAGAYKFIKYENKVVYYEANENYWKGAPKIKYIQFKETTATEVAAAVAAGTVDAGELTGSKDRFNEVKGFNSNGDITGDIITTSKVDNLGYGYIGINADTVNVGGEPASEASKNLRKALSTVLAVYRDSAFDSYYGEAASVIQYPISNTSWAAPQPTDDGYHMAFSLDVNGNDIYTSDMTPDQRYDAAQKAALDYLAAAGYTVADGKVTAAPAGASLSYEVIIPADGIGDHPSFAVLTDAQAALAEIGMELKINDPADSNVLWNALDAGEQNLWCAAWQSTIDPDMYQTYHSSGIVGRGGSDSNHYHIDLPQLDELIVEARKSDDQAFRKATYKQVLDIIVDFAVEIPAYQRQNCVVFSTERINIDTLTPDITTYWGWMREIETLEMN